MLERANIQSLREFLMEGGELFKFNQDSYENRIDKVYKRYLKVAAEYKINERTDLSEAFHEAIFEHQTVYMEIGMQAGFRLAIELLGTHG